ncbi:Hint domain-containing protein [Salipiger sp. H15]|uniref:Hint domain-containing protein n=1 Tax=Alloyangia sp. H15 TaxID=3029062 RepID=A0AAU8ANB4_9RHOB
MAQEDIQVTPYNGSVAAADLLGSERNLLISNFGSPTTGTLEDGDGILGSGDDGATTFNGSPVTYIGSGTVTPGIDLGILGVSLGTPVDVVVFKAGGDTYFHYPAGEPNLLGNVFLVVDIDATPYTIFTPLCFTHGTEIRTPTGHRPIESLSAGDWVMDIHGDRQVIEWIGKTTLRIPDRPEYRKWHPVRVAANVFGRGVPYRPTWLSQQHRVLVRSALNELYFDEADCLAPIVRLADGKNIRIDRTVTEVTYFHILCAEHKVLSANGMPAESLHLGQVARCGVERAAFGEFEIEEEIASVPAAAPILRGFEARLLAGQYEQV